MLEDPKLPLEEEDEVAKLVDPPVLETKFVEPDPRLELETKPEELLPLITLLLLPE